MFGLQFGVEIEADGFPPEVLRDILRKKGMVHSVWGRQFHFPDSPDFHFEVKRDGSIPFGSEITTPPMREGQLPILKRMLALLQSCGMKETEFCGLHIHVGLPDHLWHWIDHPGRISKVDKLRDCLYHNWKVLLPNIARAYAPRKCRERYCRMDFDKDDFGRERYLAVNATFAHFPTVEYRFFDGHLHFRVICRAIRLACGLTSLALRGTRVEKCGPGESVEDLLRSLDVK